MRDKINLLTNDSSFLNKTTKLNENKSLTVNHPTLNKTYLLLFLSRQNLFYFNFKFNFIPFSSTVNIREYVHIFFLFACTIFSSMFAHFKFWANIQKINSCCWWPTFHIVHYFFFSKQRAIIRSITFFMDNPFKERLTTFLDFDQKQTLLERKYNLKRVITLLWVFRLSRTSDKSRPDPSLQHPALSNFKVIKVRVISIGITKLSTT